MGANSDVGRQPHRRQRATKHSPVIEGADGMHKRNTSRIRKDLTSTHARTHKRLA